MIYPRKLGLSLSKEVHSKEIIVVTGMRRTGKTTLMRQIFDDISSENKVFLDLENPLNQKIFEELNYDNILANLKTFHIDPNKKAYLFLDEIQLFPQATKAIKYLYDHYDLKFFLTGSSSFYLKNLFPESLSGRKIVFELFPLDFEEFLTFQGKNKTFELNFDQKAKNKNKIIFERYKKCFEEYMRFGGFPGIVLESDFSRKRTLLEDIFTSYFEQDVRALADFKSLSKIRDLILLLSKRVGSKIEISKISSELGISRDTVYSYLSFLEKTYFLFFIRPLSRSVDREVSGTKKVYFCDSGLLYWLGNTDDGSLFENSVFHNLHMRGTLNYYERRHGREIDFILDKQIGFEVKRHGQENDIKQLTKIGKEIGLEQMYLVTQEFFDHPAAIPATDL